MLTEIISGVTVIVITGACGYFIRRLLRRIENLEHENKTIKEEFVRQVQFDRFVDQTNSRLDQIINILVTNDAKKPLHPPGVR